MVSAGKLEGTFTSRKCRLEIRASGKIWTTIMRGQSWLVIRVAVGETEDEEHRR